MDHNPIDKDKITETPSILPYAHHVGSPIIKPMDKGKTKGKALAAMEQQTHMQMEQIKEQIELLATQAKAIQDRIEISEKIYLADMGFEPLISHMYYLYERNNGSWVLSMIAPQEWGRSKPFSHFVSAVRLLADHTWELIDLDN